MNDRTIAYFSMEIALEAAMPTYAAVSECWLVTPSVPPPT